jgi:4-hydroxy-tetrahydrodipicolinate reductase
MHIALVGIGAMGRIVKRMAEENGHPVVLTVGSDENTLSSTDLAGRLSGVEGVIDFSTADAVVRNVEACMMAGVPLVEGTTGWASEMGKVRDTVDAYNGSFVYGANFSIGVNLFYRLTEFAAELFSKFPEYEVFIEEQHHSRKKDAPSGTALKLKAVVSRHSSMPFSVSSTRAGNIPGTHRVGFDGPADQILLEHTARSREGFAAGSLMAAEWIVGKKGFYEFTELMDETLK